MVNKSALELVYRTAGGVKSKRDFWFCIETRNAILSNTDRLLTKAVILNFLNAMI